jgi:hypothetical protein
MAQVRVTIYRCKYVHTGHIHPTSMGGLSAFRRGYEHPSCFNAPGLAARSLDLLNSANKGESDIR